MMERRDSIAPFLFFETQFLQFAIGEMKFEEPGAGS
jgi:hypothetical protein